MTIAQKIGIGALLVLLFRKKKCPQVWAAMVPFNGYDWLRESLRIQHHIPVNVVSKMSDDELQIVYGGLQLINSNEYNNCQYRDFMKVYDAIMEKYEIG